MSCYGFLGKGLTMDTLSSPEVKEKRLHSRRPRYLVNHTHMVATKAVKDGMSYRDAGKTLKCGNKFNP